MSALLRFDDVTLKRGGRLLFERLSFALAPGEVLQVTGPNGSGKSSLLRLAAGLLTAESGSVSRSPLALADDHPALDRDLSLKRALDFWTSNSVTAMESFGLARLAEIPVRFVFGAAQARDVGPRRRVDGPALAARRAAQRARQRRRGTPVQDDRQSYKRRWCGPRRVAPAASR